MTEQEVKWEKQSLHRRQNFGTILASSAATMVALGWMGPASMFPGVLINGYYTWRVEKMKHGESWKKRLKKMIPIFNAKSHGDDGHGGHDDHGGHGSHDTHTTHSDTVPNHHDPNRPAVGPGSEVGHGQH